MSDTAMFIMPHFSKNFCQDLPILQSALDSILLQSDKNWELCIVDDASPDKTALEFLQNFAYKHKNIFLKLQTKNSGPGVCRNTGISLATNRGSPFLLFLDSDDCCHPDWLQTVRQKFSNAENDVVYTSLIPVDNYGQRIKPEKITPSIKQILKSHKHNPPVGRNAWIRIVTEFGYVNLTSATAVRTSLAGKYPFPAERISEDSHTWLRYSAGGKNFCFTPDTPVRYRITLDEHGSNSRQVAGGKKTFYKELIRVDNEGFEIAMKISKQYNRMATSEENSIRKMYYLRLAKTMTLESQSELADMLNERANAISEP